MPIKDDSHQRPSKTKRGSGMESSISKTMFGSKTKAAAPNLEWYLQNIKAYESLDKLINDLYRDYYAQYGRSDVDDPELNRKLLQAIDDAIAQGHWQDGLFFEVSGKNIRELRDKLARELDLGDAIELETTGAVSGRAAEKDEVLVYVGLHLAAGQHLTQWQTALSAIGQHSVGRPIYRNEKDVKAYLDAKPDKNRDTYVAVYIHENDILKSRNGGWYAEDRLGHELLLVKDNTIKPENIYKFVHGSGEYIFKNNELVKI